jgi:hypothetical protein
VIQQVAELELKSAEEVVLEVALDRVGVGELFPHSQTSCSSFGSAATAKSVVPGSPSKVLT